MQFIQILYGETQRDVVRWEHACGSLSVWFLQTFDFLPLGSIVLGGRRQLWGAGSHRLLAEDQSSSAVGPLPHWQCVT